MKDVTLVMACALVGAFLCERYVVSKGASPLAAASTAGTAFLGLSGLGLVVLNYLAATN